MFGPAPLEMSTFLSLVIFKNQNQSNGIICGFLLNEDAVFSRNVPNKIFICLRASHYHKNCFTFPEILHTEMKLGTQCTKEHGEDSED